ncbi:hypothetical protein GCG21_02575 [Pseudactinotalea sp. HY160]|uniref:hypothetical protein n=1 Tax=Pseudactinotalea sp. HY160 TaxID=2654490 RepID=UPI00128B902B|nr:hypothetical protein [Pseudactinotalea sp. HY160]MPV48912.1 hypothetical protein [Pseudactinotalea sp. HY160]
MSPSAPNADSYVNTPEILALIRRVFVGLIILTCALGAAGLVAGALIDGWPGVWAALIAAALGLFFTGTTVGGLYLVAGRGMHLLMAVLLGGWMVKMVILGVVVFWLRGQEFYHRGTFAATILAIVIGALIVEIVLVARARIPYVGGAQPAPAVTSVTANPRPPAAGDGPARVQPRDRADSGPSSPAARTGDEPE